MDALRLALSMKLPSLRQRWFLLALVLFFVAWSVPYSVKITNNPDSSAFLRWRPQILALADGKDSYLLYNYPNPPIMALILLPLCRLEPMTGALIWYFLKVAMALLSLFWIFRMIETPDRPFPEWAKVLTVLLSMRPIMGDLSHGNVNLFILFLVVAALYAYCQGKDLLGGVILALAISCKVTPALFVFYFVWKCEWKMLAGCALGLGLFLFVIPGLYLGQTWNIHLLGSWQQQMVKPFVVDGVVFYSEYINQSLPGVVMRLLTHSPSESWYPDNVTYTPLEYHNLATLSHTTARWIINGCMVLLGVLGMWVCRTPKTTRQGWQLSAELSLVLLGMLLFSERTWKHHCVTLAMPLAVLCHYLANQSAWKPRAWVIGVLSAVFLLMASTSTVKQLGWWEESAKLAQIYGAYMWVCLILVTALVAMLRKPVAAASPEESKSSRYISPGMVPS